MTEKEEEVRGRIRNKRKITGAEGGREEEREREIKRNLERLRESERG